LILYRKWRKLSNCEVFVGPKKKLSEKAELIDARFHPEIDWHWAEIGPEIPAFPSAFCGCGILVLERRAYEKRHRRSAQKRAEEGVPGD
jgi:hypothetical protein